jgi:hypothetical protein
MAAMILILGTFSMLTGNTQVVFSPGLYGNIPSIAYSGVLNTVRSQNCSVLIPTRTLTKQTFETLCDTHEKDKLPLISHSSVDSNVLTSHRLERALLLDPAVLPRMEISGLKPSRIKAKAPVHIILTRFYNSFVKSPFQPEIEDANLIQLDYGGHSDLLDGILPWVASKIGIESDPDGISKYKEFLALYLSEWLKNDD